MKYTTTPFNPTRLASSTPPLFLLPTPHVKVDAGGGITAALISSSLTCGTSGMTIACLGANASCGSGGKAGWFWGEREKEGRGGKTGGAGVA